MSPATITVILQLVAQYGPSILAGIEGLFTKASPTVADIQAVFAGLKPYSAFGISLPAAVAPATPAPAA